MVVRSFDHLDQQVHEALTNRSIPAVIDQMPQKNPQTPQPVVVEHARAKPRVQVEQAMIFWNCMFPYGWSLGGLIMLLINARRKRTARAGGPSSALGSLLFGLLSTLFYFVAVAQTEKYRVTQAPSPGESPLQV